MTSVHSTIFFSSLLYGYVRSILGVRTSASVFLLHLFSPLLFSSCLSCHQLNFAPLHHPIDGWKSKKTCVAIPQATITVPNIKILLIYSFPTFYSRSYYTLLSSKTCSLLNYLFEDLSLVLPWLRFQ